MTTNPPPPAALPLDGVRVLDLSRALAGPLCGSMLSDLGATVTKVEPLDGDPSRAWGPFQNGRSLYFDAINHGKRSLLLDFRDAGSRDVLTELVRWADVVIESFRPGVMDDIGLGADDLRALNPNAVVVSVTGFGSVGPLRSAAGLDQIAQSMSGLTSVTGADRDHQYRVGVPIVDFMTGLVAVIGALTGLLQQRAGTGARVETSLLETALYSLVFQAQRGLRLGEDAEPQGNMHPTIQPYGTYRTRDGELTLAASTQRHWRGLCTILGDETLTDRAAYATPQARVDAREDLTADIEALLAHRTTAEWIDLLRGAGIPAGPVNGVVAALHNEQVDAMQLVTHVTDEHGADLPLLAAPFTLDGNRLAITSPPPAPGFGAREALTVAGFTDEQVADLVARGIVGAA